MTNYESVFIVDGSLSKEATDQAVTLVKEQVAKAGGQIEKVQELGKRTLAYPIQKKHEGTYFLMLFKSAPSALVPLKQALEMAEPVLRSLVLKLDH